MTHLTEDHLHVLLDALSTQDPGGEHHSQSYDDPDDPKGTPGGWDRLRDEAKAIIEQMLAEYGRVSEMYVAMSFPVRNAETVDEILRAPLNHDGTSEWHWYWLATGDLVFGCYPRGATFEGTEVAREEDRMHAEKHGTVSHHYLEVQDEDTKPSIKLSTVVEQIAETWAGSDAEDLRNNGEYLRGQVELVRELWGSRVLVDDLGLWPAWGTEFETTEACQILVDHVIGRFEKPELLEERPDGTYFLGDLDAAKVYLRDNYEIHERRREDGAVTVGELRDGEFQMWGTSESGDEEEAWRYLAGADFGPIDAEYDEANLREVLAKAKERSDLRRSLASNIIGRARLIADNAEPEDFVNIHPDHLKELDYEIEAVATGLARMGKIPNEGLFEPGEEDA